MMAYSTYVVGGPEHLLPPQNRMYMVGLKAAVSAGQSTGTLLYTLPENMVLCDIQLGASAFGNQDTWTIYIGDEKVVENLPHQLTNHPVQLVGGIGGRILQAGTVIRIEMTNTNNTARTMYAALRFLR